MANRDDDRELSRYTARPPADFNAEYANFLLARDHSSFRPSRIDHITVVIALLTSLAGISVSVVNLVNYRIDRSDREQKANFDNQIAITRIYFEKMAGGDFKANCRDAMLYARASLAAAGLDENQVNTQIQVNATPGEAANRGSSRSSLQTLATIIYTDISSRAANECDAHIALSRPTKPGGVLNALPSQPSVSTYGLGQVAAPPPDPKQRFAIYVHYQSGESADRAESVRRVLGNDPAFFVPGIERVKAVPEHDQIRIYRASDANQAYVLQRRLGLRNAQIVNLETAYSQLPARVMEVWLRTIPGKVGVAPPDMPNLGD